MERTEVENSRKPGIRYAVQRAVFGLTSGMLLAGGHQVMAASWEISPNLTLSEIYLQNDGLALANQADSEYVTEVSPSIGVRKEGQRTQLDLYYRMQNLWYSKSDDLDDTYQQYAASLNNEIVRDMFFLGLSATRTQQILDPNSVVTFDNLTTSTNRSDVDTYSVAPSYQYQFGSAVNADASATFNRVSYSGSAEADTDNISYFASLVSGDRFDRVSWAGSFARSEFLRNDGTDDEYAQSSLLDLGYKLEKRLTALAGVGYESNNIEQSGAGQSGSSWKVGARWDPTIRTSVTATIGERFYGKSAFFQMSHKQRRSQWQLSYTENITHVSQLVLNSNPYADANAAQEDSALVSPGNPSDTTIINTPNVTTGLYLSKRWNASYIMRTFRSELNLRGYYEDRELAIDSETDNIFGGSATWSLAIGSRTTSSVSGDWQRQQLFENGKQDDDIWSASVELSRELGTNSVASISARRVKRDSPSAQLNYEQNQIAATLVLGL